MPTERGPCFSISLSNWQCCPEPLHWEDLGCINKAECKQQANDLDKLGPKVFAICPKQHLDKIDVDNDDSITTVKVFSIEPNGHLDKTEELILTFHKIYVDKIDNYGEDKDNEDEEDLGEYEDEDKDG